MTKFPDRGNLIRKGPLIRHSKINVLFWFCSIDEALSRTPMVTTYAGITLTGYTPPGLTLRPLIFSVKIPAPGTTFQCKNPVPWSKKRNKSPPIGHNLPSSNAKIWMKWEHNTIRAVSFQIFHNCLSDNFLLSWESSIPKYLYNS